MTRRLPMLAALTGALAISAAPGLAVAQDGVLDPSPEGVVWNLTSAAGETVPDGVDANLFLESGDANGNTGCNSFSGSYEIDGSSIEFGENFAVTQAFCEDPAGAVEQAYLAGLSSTASWAIDGPELSFADGEGNVVLTFEEPAVEIFETDIIALDTELNRLERRISNTRQELRELNVDGLRQRVIGNEAELEEVARTVNRQNVPGLRDRVIANEAVLEDLSERFVRVRARVRDLEERVAALEEAVFTATPAE